eukprot:CAMPEP_0184656668 /NCGR_PEP_ID=MMETSP0308-20130426/16672_1 /TAXON_ID=38269 /ORGANISM="Gloeochaete witrockiana, Strain SAG 46.84" /LENGTH=305 /DNA_ID=CAMNT_0027093897 /DNA_START=163 /DNA_END=1081 /DNA_ORIENTATION=+
MAELLFRTPLHVAPIFFAEADKKFEIKDTVTVESGVNGLPKVVLKHFSGASAEVYLQGANVVSWKSNFVEYLLLSDTAVFEEDKPIRGGIPICWPQFGPGELPQHGFARNQPWALGSSRVTKDQDVIVTLELADNDFSRGLWPYKFRAFYTIRLTGAQLNCELKIVNTDDKPFSFTGALHTYLRVSNVADIQIRGLGKVKYIDKLADGAEVEELKDPLSLEGPADRVYLDAPNELRLLDRKVKRGVVVRKYGFKDAVVWTPWDKHPSAEWPEFVCLEAASAASPVTLTPGAEWEGWENFTAVSLM